jgi:hypothetical protein
MEPNQEESMSTLADDIQNQINSGRKTIERSLDDVRDL